MVVEMRRVHDESTLSRQAKSQRSHHSTDSPRKKQQKAHQTHRRYSEGSPMKTQTEYRGGSHDTDERLVSLKSFMWCVVDRLDSCTNICTAACGREKDVLHSPSAKQKHFSSKLQPLQVTAAAEDFQHFAIRGSFPNDGTFPVSDAELLDARYHSLDDDSEVSVAMARNFQSPPESFRRHGSMRSGRRGVLREYFDQCSGEKDMTCGSTQYSSSSPPREMANRYGPQQGSCHMSTNSNTQVPTLASGRG